MGDALFQSAERRSFRRISDAIALRIDVIDTGNDSAFEPAALPQYPSHVVSLSPKGLKFYHVEPVDDDQRVRVAMRFFPEQTVIELDARVVSAGEDRTRSKNDRFFASLAFENVSDEMLSLLLDHIDLVARQSFGGAVKLIN